MNLAKLRSNIGKTVRFFPRPKVGDMFVPDARNHWLLVCEEEKGISVLNMVTDHEFLLPFDSIREYREPEILVLRAQVVLTDSGGADLIPFADAPNHELTSLPGGTFEGPLTIGLSATDYRKELELPVVNETDLPSQQAAGTIRCILSKRLISGGFYSEWAAAVLSPSVVPVPFEARSTKTLQENLSNVDDNYREHDLFELFELRGHKINVHLINGGSEYIEDAAIQLRIDKCPGMILAEQIHEKPPENGSFMNVRVPHIHNDGYPRVEIGSDGYSVFEEIGHIKHGLATIAFQVPLRVVFLQQAKGQRIRIQCSIVGKNLRSPRTEELAITVK